MNHFEKIGLWSQSDIRKEAENIKACIAELDMAINDISMEQLEAFANLCFDVNWKIQNESMQQEEER